MTAPSPCAWVIALGLLLACAVGPGTVAAAPDTFERAAGENTPSLDREALAEFVDGLVMGRMRPHGIAGVTLAIVHDGELVLARGYGHADVAAGRAVDPADTLFRPGSISKTFVWTAVMQLVEQGRLDLDAEIQSYLPDLELRHQQGVTLNHLMAHMPGFEESAMGHLFENDPDAVLPLAAYLARYQPAQVYAPGVVPAYSNFGSALAGLIVANASGLSFEDYMERHLFAPLGMDSSTFREPWGEQRSEPMPEALEHRLSRGYRRHGGQFVAGDFEFIGGVGPAGALSTTAMDMARWMIAHLEGGALEGRRILAPETARRMHQRHAGLDPDLPGMAHGFMEGRFHGHRSIGHGGGTVHFVSDMQLFPDLGFGVFISTNTTGGQALLRDAIRLIVARFFPRGDEPVPLAAIEPSADNARYAGSYLATRRNHTTLEKALNVVLVDVGLVDEPGVLLLAGPMEVERFREVAPATFRGEDTEAVIRFAESGDGTRLLLHSSYPIMAFEKVSPLENPRVGLALLAAGGLVLLGVPAGAWLRREQPPDAGAVQWASGVTVAAAMAWLLFYALVGFGLMAVAGDLGNFFYAIPNAWLLAGLAMGLVAAPLTLAAVALLYPVWGQAAWSPGRRLRHTGVVAVLLGTLILLWQFNAIGFNLYP